MSSGVPDMIRWIRRAIWNAGSGVMDMLCYLKRWTDVSSGVVIWCAGYDTLDQACHLERWIRCDGYAVLSETLDPRVIWNVGSVLSDVPSDRGILEPGSAVLI